MRWDVSDARAASSRARSALLRFADGHPGPDLIEGEGADLGVPPVSPVAATGAGGWRATAPLCARSTWGALPVCWAWSKTLQQLCNKVRRNGLAEGDTVN